MSRCGYFGGTFDPIHLGHLHLAIELAERHNLSQVFFCPTSQSPHKKESPPIATKEQRLAMTTAAIAPLPMFTLLDLEIHKPAPCYTIDTVEALIALDLQQKRKNVHYFLLLGEDSLERLHTWKSVESLLTLAPPLVGSRGSQMSVDHTLQKFIKKGMTPIPIVEISSTLIRSRIQKGLYCGHLLPAKVWDYIEQHQIYR